MWKSNAQKFAYLSTSDFITPPAFLKFYGPDSLIFFKDTPYYLQNILERFNIQPWLRVVGIHLEQNKH